MGGAGGAVGGGAGGEGEGEGPAGCDHARDCADDALCPAIGGCDGDICTIDACVDRGCTQGVAPECTACNDSCGADGIDPPEVCECAKFGDDLGRLGSYDAIELCIPWPSDLDRRLAEILPDVSCGAGRGLIGCDLDLQRRCSWEAPVQGREPLLPCGVWNKLCEVSRLGSVRRIRGMFYL